jgi:hypothetical protein
MTYITGGVPVGLYNAQNLADLGIGHNAVDTYLDQQTGRESGDVPIWGKGSLAQVKDTFNTSLRRVLFSPPGGGQAKFALERPAERLF